MGFISGAAYNFGVCVGIASFQASANQNALTIQSLQTAQNEANILINAGKFENHTLTADISYDDRNHHVMHESLQDQRENWGANIQTLSVVAGAAYSLGLLIGISEGTASSDTWSKLVIHDSLQSARIIILTTFGMIGFDRELMDSILFHASLNGPHDEFLYQSILKWRVGFHNALNVDPRVE